MEYNVNLTENLAVLGLLQPASQSNSGGTNSDGVYAVGPFSMAKVQRVLFVVEIGALGSSSTVDFKVQACATSTGSFYDVIVPGTDSTVVKITQVSTTATILALLEIKAETLASVTVANSVAVTGVGPYIKGVLTVGTAASLVSVIALGSTGYGPASDYDSLTDNTKIATYVF